MGSLWLVVVVLCCIQAVVADTNYYFNPAYQGQCAQGCDFNSPSIWIPNGIPGAKDNVVLNFSSPNSQDFVFINASTSVSLIQMTQSNMEVIGGDLTVMQVNVDSDSSLSVSSNSQLFLNNPGTSLLSGNVTVRDEGKISLASSQAIFNSISLLDNSQLLANLAICSFAQRKLVVGANAVLNCSVVQFASIDVLIIDQVFSVNALILFGGNYILPNGINAGFISLDLTHNASLEVNQAFRGQVNISTTNRMILRNVPSAEFNYDSFIGPSIGGDGGLLQIFDSSVTINGDAQAPLFDGTLEISGNSNLVATNFQVAQVTIDQSTASLSGNFVITGTLTVTNSTLTLPANIKVGDLTVNNEGSVQMTDGVTYVSDTVSVDSSSSIVISHAALYPSTFFSNGDVTLSNGASIVAQTTQGDFTSNTNLTVLDNSYITWLSGTGVFVGSLYTAPLSRLYFSRASFNLLSATIQQVLDVPTFLVVANSSLTLPYGYSCDYVAVQSGGTLLVSTIASAQLYIASDGQVTMTDAAANITNRMYTESPAVSGSGVLTIIDSFVSVSSKTTLDAGFGGDFILIGETTVNAQNFSVQNLNVGFVINNVSANNVILLGSGFEVLGGPSNFVGQVIAYNQGITVSGDNVEFTGPVQVLAGSSLQSTGSLTIIGDLTNNGSVTSSVNALTVKGNYISYKESTLVATLSDSSKPVITVTNGSMYIDGQLKYTLKKQLKSQTFLVATATDGKIVGQFTAGTATAQSNSIVKSDLSVLYSDNSLSVKYTLNIHDLPNWIWIIVGVGGGVLLLIIILVTVICVRRRRHGYNPVR